jgi:tubulin polyglutamylase TTLL6/13
MNCVAQRYISNPCLLDGLKFDLRVYVLLCGVDPLRIMIYQEGLARFATERYNTPNCTNMSHLRMHLTNYAVNKGSTKFIANNSPLMDDVGHKRSLTAVLA